MPALVQGCRGSHSKASHQSGCSHHIVAKFHGQPCLSGVRLLVRYSQPGLLRRNSRRFTSYSASPAPGHPGDGRKRVHGSRSDGTSRSIPDRRTLLFPPGPSYGHLPYGPAHALCAGANIAEAHLDAPCLGHCCRLHLDPASRTGYRHGFLNLNFE